MSLHRWINNACKFTYHFKNCFKIFSHWCSHEMNYLSHCLEKTKMIPDKYYDWLDKLKNGFFRSSKFPFHLYHFIQNSPWTSAGYSKYSRLFDNVIYLKNLASWQFDLSTFISTHQINGTRQFLNMYYIFRFYMPRLKHRSCRFFVAGWARDGDVYVERVIGGYCYH